MNSNKRCMDCECIPQMIELERENRKLKLAVRELLKKMKWVRKTLPELIDFSEFHKRTGKGGKN